MLSLTSFNSKKSLENYIRSIIAEIGICSSVKQFYPSYYNFFSELFQNHPNYPEKTLNTVDIFITQNKISPAHLELNLLKQTQNIISTDNISWRSCISGKSKNHLKSALRVAIHDQILEFRRNCPLVQCCFCKSTDASEYHVDHINHFEEILAKFLLYNILKLPSNFKDSSLNLKTFLPSDLDFENSWKMFHKKEARLRLLCSSCNLRRPHFVANKIML